jgi:hypothetical protein
MKSKSRNWKSRNWCLEIEVSKSRSRNQCLEIKVSKSKSRNQSLEIKVSKSKTSMQLFRRKKHENMIICIILNCFVLIVDMSMLKTQWVKVRNLPIFFKYKKFVSTKYYSFWPPQKAAASPLDHESCNSLKTHCFFIRVL